jgi:hypothetical protein
MKAEKWSACSPCVSVFSVSPWFSWEVIPVYSVVNSSRIWPKRWTQVST